jgi:hypothetical protein
MRMNKFKYTIFPDRTYLMTFDDFDGNPFTVDVPGEEIIGLLRTGYALGKMPEDLDKETKER